NLRDVPYDAVKSFVAISEIATLPEALVVNANVPVNSLKDLIDLARSKPHQLNFSSGGVGTLSSLGMYHLMKETGTDIVPVIYSAGGSAMMVGVLGNETQMMLTSIPSASGNIEAGKIKALAVTSKTRFSGLPNVPSIAEIAAATPGLGNLKDFDEND